MGVSIRDECANCGYLNRPLPRPAHLGADRVRRRIWGGIGAIGVRRYATAYSIIVLVEERCRLDADPLCLLKPDIWSLTDD